MTPAARLAAGFLALVAAAHLVRILLAVDVTVKGASVPMWMSAAAVLLTGGLSFMLWREGRRR